ncbi:hypothetical protein ACLOJK_035296 [Asimina triloba]
MGGMEWYANEKDVSTATLADSFLADLDDLSDNEATLLDEGGEDVGDMEEDADGDIADLEALNYDDLDSVSKLQKTQRYIKNLGGTSKKSMLQASTGERSMELAKKNRDIRLCME